MHSEKKYLETLDFFLKISILPINCDLSKTSEFQLKDALASDIYIVFSASYIKGWLINF